MLVSVLMPCYNAASYVGPAVRSVLSQTWKELEIIVVDDGSQDESFRVVSGFNDKRLKVVRQQNSGQCAAANHAFSLSSGKLIKFLDADDLLSPDHISRQVKRLSEKQASVAMGEWSRFYGNDLTTARFPHLPMYRDAKPVDWLVSEFATGEPMMQCALWLIPRQVLKRSGLWDERFSLINDFEFFTRVLLASEEILFTPGARLYYRSGLASSLSGMKSREAALSYAESILSGTNYLMAADDSPGARRACANVLQTFEYTFFPKFPDVRRKVRERIKELGGGDLEPSGPPGFHKLRSLIGWKAARRVQRAAECIRVNQASRRRAATGES